MRKLRSIAITLAILSIAFWMILGIYFVITNHWGAFAIAPLLIPLFFLTLIADLACIVVLVYGLMRWYFDRLMALLAFFITSFLIMIFSQ
jgi:hypothetical protein